MLESQASKTRKLVDGVSVSADVYLPAYAHGQPWKSDMRGAVIPSAKVTAADWATLGTLDVTLQDSDDGETWDDWKAFTQLSADGSEILDLDTERTPRRFIRAFCDVGGGAGSATVTVELHYEQVGPRGEYADGVPDRENG